MIERACPENRRCGAMGMVLAACLVVAASGIRAEGAKGEIDAAQRAECAVLVQPDKVQHTLDQAQALLQGMRTSPDPGAVNRARTLIQCVLTQAPADPRAWTLKAWDEMVRHRFHEALTSAQRAHELGLPTGVSLGLEADALVELGRYEQALVVTQKQLDIFPGLPAQSRAAHLRFLHGDLQGAISLLKDNLIAAPAGSEAHAWASRQLAELYLAAGQFEPAEQALAAAARLFPAKAQDAALRGRLQEAQGRPADALALFRQALDQYPSPEYAVAAWRLARQSGAEAETRRLALLLNGMARLDQAGDRLFRRTFAEYYGQQKDRLAEAERLAREEVRARPDIYSHALLAFVLRQAGQHREAKRQAKVALRLGTQDPRLRQWALGQPRNGAVMPPMAKEAG